MVGFFYFKIMENEIWKSVGGYEGLYEVSDFGRVRSLNYGGCGRAQVLKGVVNRYGYLTVFLFKAGSKKRFTIHSLVAKNFITQNYTEKGMVVNHKDFNRNNNLLSNLEIVTPRENTNMKHLPSSSKYVGVSLKGVKWRSMIVVNGKLLYLGTFNTELEASNYYESALICVNENRIGDILFNRIKQKGYSFDKAKKKWSARVYEKGVRKFLGLFKTEEEARLAVEKYLNKKRPKA